MVTISKKRCPRRLKQELLARWSPKDEHCFHPQNGAGDSHMQQGSVILTGRKFGPDVWQFRWSEKDRSGRRIYRKRVIGTVQQYPDAQAAREVTTALIGHINASDSARKVTVQQICDWVQASFHINYSPRGMREWPPCVRAPGTATGRARRGPGCEGRSRAAPAGSRSAPSA